MLSDMLHVSSHFIKVRVACLDQYHKSTTIYKINTEHLLVSFRNRANKIKFTVS